MKIGGFQKTTLLDYPGHVSAILWTVGCNFRCPFCYNTDLVKEKSDLFSEEEILNFLKKRRDFLEALSISGGEPFLQKDLKDFCKKVKDLGYKVKIDTNGTFPEKLKEMIEEKLVDYIAMDVKAPKEKYDKLSGVKTDIEQIRDSIKIIMDSNIDYEFKTTVIPKFLDKDDIKDISEWIKGSKKYYLQQFKNDASVISSYLKQIKPYSEKELQNILKEIKPYFKECKLRGT